MSIRIYPLLKGDSFSFYFRIVLNVCFIMQRSTDMQRTPNTSIALG